jgi:pimeloyl-ACP methyl ester carboxylesterase
MLPRDFVSALVERYQGRVFALDHPTLSVTPIENVRWLATMLKALPPGQRLDLDVIAHSRGGLVGRVMCERPSDAGLDPGRLQVRTLVMIATPNAGTPLADRKHIGAFIDTLTNILEFIPDNPATDTLDVLLALLKQVAIGVTGGLEGLKSMDPGSEFLRQLLNQPSAVSTFYRAMTANYEPGPNTPLGRYARDFLTDLVFGGTENDLVVPTHGVFARNGATPFPIPNPLRLEATEMVDHSGFWNNSAALEALHEWLELPQDGHAREVLASLAPEAVKQIYQSADQSIGKSGEASRLRCLDQGK